MVPHLGLIFLGAGGENGGSRSGEECQMRWTGRDGWQFGCPDAWTYNRGTDMGLIPMSPSQTISIRVRYVEVDAMGYLHHSRFFQYFEMGRIELLRAGGFSYADMEKQGIC